MSDILKIQCPFCTTLLSVANQPGIETKSLTCPVCKQKSPFTSFKRVNVGTNTSDPKTEYPGDDPKTDYAYREEKSTEFPQMNFTIGKVTVMDTRISYQLRPGRNVIGRKASKSEADFQIDTAEKRMMSREHIVIDVKKVPGKGLVHYVSLFKERVNETRIGNEPLFYGDCVILKHGDLIRLPDATLKFEIPDEERTEI